MRLPIPDENRAWSRLLTAKTGSATSPRGQSASNRNHPEDSATTWVGLLDLHRETLRFAPLELGDPRGCGSGAYRGHRGVDSL